ncbi:hypothetical protein sS8_0332 [Methylocaldum marinum]|uniref:Uncharacterized protein n=1 Tax=Methylocaldum marinum TaxID=1432792 RepID=A0A286P3S8_9GAMM|nr:hypothetical protein [Methylocaldum marinum]BBA32300.1 hypothetical protein sS8_0332 [Methylocaldum marinum]
MNVDELGKLIDSESTMMDLSRELWYCHQLSQLSTEDVANHKVELLRVLEALRDSHTQAFYEVTPRHFEHLKRFVEWLDKILHLFSQQETRDELREIRDVFRLNID